MRGQFRLAARLAESMRTDDACAVAYENRLAPQREIPVKLVPAKGARGGAVAGEAEALFGQDGVGIHPDTLADIEGCLVNHGIAFGVCVYTPREDGSRVDVELKYFPIEFIMWDAFYKFYRAYVDPESVPANEISKDDIAENTYGYIGGAYVPVVHGDGRWVVFKKHEVDPFKQEAAVMPASLVWARHAFALRDWAKGSVSHGNAKVIGEMPESVPLQGPDGGASPEAQAFMTLLRDIASADSPVGIRPSGAKTDLLTNNSTAWQVWNELVQNAEKAAARIYLGTDGTLGSQGGAPGVDIDSLFGVAATKVRGDLKCIERGLLTGVIEPWCAVNFGDSSLAPKRVYLIPDGDEKERQESHAKRSAAFFADLKTAHDAGIVLTPEFIDQLAEDYGVRPLNLLAPPTLTPPVAAGTPSPQPAPAEGGEVAA